MIQVYSAQNKNYKMNGDAIIHPIKCEANFILNGVWSIEMECPIDQNLDLLSVGSVLSVNTPYGVNQLYRIYSTNKSDFSINVDAMPIFLDSKNECFIYDTRPTNKSGQQALDLMLSGNSKYSAQSNIAKTSTAYYIMKNFIEALNGNDENSFLNRWGGEIVYKNYVVIVNEKIGNDNGLRAEFGFNLLGINENIDMSNVATSIIPQSYNGYCLPKNETVDSPHINNYPVVYQKIIKYEDIKMKEDATEDDIENGVTICDNMSELYIALRNRAKKEYENEIDLPKITYDVDMVDLSKTDLYKQYKQLLNVNLGDTVYVKHRRLNITTTARVVELVYDCITEKVVSLVLGDYKSNYFNDVSTVVNSAKEVIDTKNKSIIAEKISGIINATQAQLKAQRNIAKKIDYRAILMEDLDPNSPTYGATSYGTKGLEFSNRRNETNTNWVWENAFGPNGLIANAVIVGLLSDRLGNNHWNLDTGELVTKNMQSINANINGLKAVNVDVTGKITATSGNIGGFDISGKKMIASSVKYFDYTSNDLTRIRSITSGSVSPSSNDYNRYDINGDGKINSSDYVIINKIINAGNRVNTKFYLYPNFDSASASSGVFEIEVVGFSTTKVTPTGNLFATGATIKSLTTDSINNNGDLNVSGNTILNKLVIRTYNSSFECCGINAGYYNGTPNLYIENSDPSGYIALSIANEQEKIYLTPKSGAYSAYFSPLKNGMCTLGDTSHRFYRLYSRYSEDATSDRRQKKDFELFDERYLKLVDMLIPTFYRFKEQTEEQSMQAGFIAQDVLEAMVKCGIDKKEFGAVKHSVWKDKETGEEKDEYSLVYAMFIPLLTYYIQNKNKELEDRISRLEKSTEGNR